MSTEDNTGEQAGEGGWSAVPRMKGLQKRELQRKATHLAHNTIGSATLESDPRQKEL